MASLTPEQAEKLRKMSNDLRWLVMEGYVTEFSDSKLFAPPPVAPQGVKKGGSSEDEHDPEDFPESKAETPEAPAPGPENDPRLRRRKEKAMHPPAPRKPRRWKSLWLNPQQYRR